MVDGVGHGEKRFDRRTHIADWFMKQLKAGQKSLIHDLWDLVAVASEGYRSGISGI
ncbi:MAG TPA: hypothetical protein VJ646_11360 [Candidatus Binatia bacterium]|nr:hypothetical protein [Candidatus Binatia bacterium]